MGDVKSLIQLYVIICEQLSLILKKSDKDYYLKNTTILLEELFI